MLIALQANDRDRIIVRISFTPFGDWFADGSRGNRLALYIRCGQPFEVSGAQGALIPCSPTKAAAEHRERRGG